MRKFGLMALTVQGFVSAIKAVKSLRCSAVICSSSRESPGEYDKIAAFVDISSEKQLFNFVQLFQSLTSKYLVQWEQAKMEYLLEINEVMNDQFINNFRANLTEARFEELSGQDVFIKCAQL